MSYTAEEAKKIRSAVKSISDRWQIRQLLIDLKEFVDERACDYKQDMDIRDDNQEIIELLEYLKEQFRGHIAVIDLLKQENPDNWR